MIYSEAVDRSTEYLRQALPLMSRQSAALHPVSYAVWYDYVSRRNPDLHADVDAHLARHGKLDEASTDALFRKYIASLDPQAAQKITEDCQRILQDMNRSAGEAGNRTASYGGLLNELGDTLQAQPGAADAATPAVLAELLRSTREMSDAMAQLQRSLAQSQREIGQLREEVSRVRNDALADGLTGLANRRAFDQQLAVCVTAAQLAPQDAGHQPLALLMVDIDFFKRVNDSYGHSFGDQVLRAVAQVLKAGVGAEGMAARYGGEEFVVLLPGARIEAAQALAEKVRNAVARCRVRRQGSEEALGNITVSLGVTAYLRGDETREFIDRADRALYMSKAGGRNRVTVLAG